MECGFKNEIRIMGYVFHSDYMERGAECEKRDTPKTCLVKIHGKEQQMKPGRLLWKIIEEACIKMTYFDKIRITESFSHEYFARRHYCKLFVNKNFVEAYSKDNSKVVSCLVGHKDFSRYADFDVNVAYIKDADGIIMARCLVFPSVFDEDGHTYRFADKQYYCKQYHQRQLINALFEHSHIDAYWSKCDVFVKQDGECIPSVLHILRESKKKWYWQPFGQKVVWMDTFVYVDGNKMYSEPPRTWTFSFWALLLVYVPFLVILFVFLRFAVWVLATIINSFIRMM